MTEPNIGSMVFANRYSAGNTVPGMDQFQPAIVVANTGSGSYPGGTYYECDLLVFVPNSPDLDGVGVTLARAVRVYPDRASATNYGGTTGPVPVGASAV